MYDMMTKGDQHKYETMTEAERHNYDTMTKCDHHKDDTIINPLTAGAAYIRVSIFY